MNVWTTDASSRYNTHRNGSVIRSQRQWLTIGGDWWTAEAIGGHDRWSWLSEFFRRRCHRRRSDIIFGLQSRWRFRPHDRTVVEPLGPSVRFEGLFLVADGGWSICKARKWFNVHRIVSSHGIFRLFLPGNYQSCRCPVNL